MNLGEGRKHSFSFHYCSVSKPSCSVLTPITIGSSGNITVGDSLHLSTHLCVQIPSGRKSRGGPWASAGKCRLG